MRLADWHPQRALLRLHLALQQAQPLGLLTLALGALAALLWAVLLPLERQQLHHLREQAAQARVQLRQPSVGSALVAAPEPPSQAQNLDHFWAALGDSRHPEQQVRRLFTLAQDLELSLQQGQYKLSCEASLPLCQYQMQLPVQGSYPQVRGLMLRSLRAIPFAALNEVRLQRDNVQSDELTAQLSFTLYLRDPTRPLTAAPAASAAASTPSAGDTP